MSTVSFFPHEIIEPKYSVFNDNNQRVRYLYIRKAWLRQETINKLIDSLKISIKRYIIVTKKKVEPEVGWEVMGYLEMIPSNRPILKTMINKFTESSSISTPPQAPFLYNASIDTLEAYESFFSFILNKLDINDAPSGDGGIAKYYLHNWNKDVNSDENDLSDQGELIAPRKKQKVCNSDNKISDNKIIREYINMAINGDLKSILDKDPLFFIQYYDNLSKICKDNDNEIKLK